MDDFYWNKPDTRNFVQKMMGIGGLDGGPVVPDNRNFVQRLMGIHGVDGEARLAPPAQPAAPSSFTMAGQYSRPREGSLDRLPASMMAPPNPAAQYGGYDPIRGLRAMATARMPFPNPRQPTYQERLATMAGNMSIDKMGSVKNDPKAYNEAFEQFINLVIGLNRGRPTDYRMANQQLDID